MAALSAETPGAASPPAVTPRADPAELPAASPAAGPLAWAAVEGGWVTREVGRQPWLVYGLVRTGEGATAPTFTGRR